MILKKIQNYKIASAIFGLKSESSPYACRLSNYNTLAKGRVQQYLYLLTIIFYAFYLLLMQPRWVLGGEMWAEMATNYFENANSPSLFVNFFSTDAGYIPMPQRLIAFMASFFRLPAASIPFFYTWSAIISTALMVGVFCIRRFRVLIASDLLRFMVAVAILMVVDFESRTFINFTYFSCFYITIITALVMVDGADDCPWWFWICPILMLSKPAVLATLPAMIFVAILKIKSNRRFLYVAIGSVLAAILQALRVILKANLSSGAPVSLEVATLFDQVLASLKYFFGFFGGYFIGQNQTLDPISLVGIGALISLFLLFVAKKFLSKESVLIFLGFSLILFNVALNCFAMPWGWNQDLVRLIGVPVFRHIIPAYFGSVLVVAGAISLISSRILFGRYLAPILFASWFVSVGWFSVAENLSKDPTSPTANNSQWQKLAWAIDAGKTPLCVPIDPWWRGYSWMYERNCKLLMDGPDWGDGIYDFRSPSPLLIYVPKYLKGKTIWFVGVLVKPISFQSQLVESEMMFIKNSGGSIRFSGSRKLDAGGGLILLDGGQGVPTSDIKSIRLSFNVPVEVAKAAKNTANEPGMAWMGN